MESLFRGTSTEIEAALGRLRQQSDEAAQGVRDAEEDVQKAMVSGAAADKPLDTLSKAKLRVSTLAGLVKQAEAALTAAQDAEARAARLADIKAVEKVARAKLDALGKARETMVTTALSLAAQRVAFDTAVTELRKLQGGGVMFHKLGQPNVGPILGACAFQIPVDTPEHALAVADRGVQSELQGLATAFESMVGSAKRECETPAQ